MKKAEICIQSDLPEGRYLIVKLHNECGWINHKKHIEGKVCIIKGENMFFEDEKEFPIYSERGMYFYLPKVKPLPPIDQNEQECDASKAQ